MSSIVINKIICVNLDKEEYIEVGELPASSIRNTPVMNTIDYLLASDWAGCRIAFAFDGMQVGENSPSAFESLYEYAVNHYDERSILNKVPQYRYILNLTHNQYYDKESIPSGDDHTLFDPLSLIALSCAEGETINMNINDKEKEEIGIWASDAMKAVNNISLYPSFAKIIPSFRNEMGIISGKLAGLNIVVTGVISGMDRYDVERFIKDNGGNPQKSVTKKTDYLVVGYKPGASKLTKAAGYGTKQISEAEFFDMVK